MRAPLEAGYSYEAYAAWRDEIKRRRGTLHGPLASGLQPLRQAELARAGKSLYLFETGGFFKVGWAAKPATRLSGVQCSNPLPVVCVFLHPGGEAEERALQLRWLDYHVRGEWFRAAPELIEDVRSGRTKRFLSDPASIPPPGTVREIRKRLRSVALSQFENSRAIAQRAVRKPLPTRINLLSEAA